MYEKFARSVVVRILLFAMAMSGSAYAASTGTPVPSSPRESAPVDLTGTWVSVVSEDWRWRMLTPGKGDYTSVPLNAAGRAAVAAWDPAQVAAEAAACLAYGPPGLIRAPGRIRIDWTDNSTLKLEFDAGRQTRLLHFGQVPPGENGSLQGVSKAEWELSSELPRRARPEASLPAPTGSLSVHTDDMRAGYLRRNGVPYGTKATMVEYFDRTPEDENGDTWLVVTTVLEDPEYLTQPFIYSTHFKREKNSAKWSPRPCEAFPSSKSIPLRPNDRQSSP